MNLTESRMRQLAGLSESQLMMETPESVADKLVFKKISDEVFITIESVKPSSMKKLFVSEKALDVAQEDEEKGFAMAKGDIFGVTINPSRGKLFVDIAVIGSSSEAKKMNGLFVNLLSELLPELSLGEQKIKSIAARDKSRSELGTSTEHPLMQSATIVESEIPFTVS